MACKDCMWNWQDVHGGEERICYNQESKFFHRTAPRNQCKKFEKRVNPNIKFVTFSPVRKKSKKRSAKLNAQH